MKRRDVLKLSVTAAALPTSAAPQQRGAASAAQTAWKPLLFDDHQAATVTALVDRIIPATDTPGAREAGVVRYLDLLLHDGPPENQQRFLEGLGWLDGYTVRAHGKPFVACGEGQQNAVLEVLEANKEEGIGPGNQFFRQAKQLTAQIYYSTQTGFRELNKGGRVPASFGCKHPEHG